MIRTFSLSGLGSRVPRAATPLPPRSTSAMASISQPLFGKLGDGISQPVIDRFALPIRQTLSAESPTPLPPETLLRLSRSHLVERIDKRFKAVTA